MNVNLPPLSRRQFLRRLGLANADLNTTNWVFIGTATAEVGGKFNFIDADAPNFPMRFYRFAIP